LSRKKGKLTHRQQILEDFLDVEGERAVVRINYFIYNSGTH